MKWFAAVVSMAFLACGDDGGGSEPADGCAALASVGTQVGELWGATTVDGSVYLQTFDRAETQWTLGEVTGDGVYEPISGEPLPASGFVVGSTAAAWVVHVILRDLHRDFGVRTFSDGTMGSTVQVSDTAYATLIYAALPVGESLYLVMRDLVDGSPTTVLVEINVANEVVNRVPIEGVSTSYLTVAVVDGVLMSAQFEPNGLADDTDDEFVIRTHGFDGSLIASTAVPTTGPSPAAGYTEYALHELGGEAVLVAHDYATESRVATLTRFSTAPGLVDSVEVSGTDQGLLESAAQAGGITLRFGQPDEQLAMDVVHVGSDGVESRRSSLVCDASRDGVHLPQGAPEPMALFRTGVPSILGTLTF